MAGPGGRLDEHGMDAGLHIPPDRSLPVEQLLRHFLALGAPAHRPPAQCRLEEALGPELARRLVATLTTGSRG
jgi:hypothetical protein